MDRVGGRFSCSIAENGSWGQHRNAIVDFLKCCDNILIGEHIVGAEVRFDVAVWQEDYEKRWITSVSVDRELVELLAKYGVVLTFSIYGSGNSSEQKAEHGS